MTASPTKMAFTDLVAGWIDRLPAGVRPYARLMRLDRPIGTWLLLFPCWWSLALASPNGLGHGPGPDLGPVPYGLYALFALGAVVMRGAGCTWNDILDRDLDARVARTAPRPIASGAVSVRRALVFLALQLAVGLVVLIQLDRLAIMLGIASLLLVGLYPLMKRITWWPQLFLGFTFNWGALLGYAAATGRLTAPALLLYAAGIAWTLAYDTIYAHQDKDDDALVGIKSTARRLGASSRLFVGLFAAVAVLLFALAFMCAGLAWPAFLALAAAAAQFAWQTARVRFDDPADCLAKFRSNRWIGWLLLAGIGLGRWLAPA